MQDVAGGRLILKRATGVVMGLWPGHAFAVGDLRANLNRAINLVNACYAKSVLGRGHVYRKDLGAFDLDRPAGAPTTVAELEGYQALVAAVPVLEVSGRVDFRALVGVVAALLAG